MKSKMAGIVPLLEVNDMIMMGNRPDHRCVFTYVSTVYSKFKEISQKKQQTAEIETDN